VVLAASVKLDVLARQQEIQKHSMKKGHAPSTLVRTVVYVNCALLHVQHKYTGKKHLLEK
jgi:hypothetical protein